MRSYLPRKWHDFIHSLTLRWTIKNPPQGLRHELVIALGIIFAAGGTFGLIIPAARPVSMTGWLPLWVVLVWLADLALGGVALIWAAATRDRVDSFTIAWPADVAIGAGSLVYGLGLTVNQNLPSKLLAMLTYTILGLFFLLRAGHLFLYLRMLSALGREELQVSDE